MSVLKKITFVSKSSVLLLFFILQNPEVGVHMDGVGVHKNTQKVGRKWYWGTCQIHYPCWTNWPVQDHWHKQFDSCSFACFYFLWSNFWTLSWLCFLALHHKANDHHGPFISCLSRLLSLVNILPFLPSVLLMNYYLHRDHVLMWNLRPPLKMDAFPIILTTTTKTLCKRKKSDVTSNTVTNGNELWKLVHTVKST